MCEVDKTTEQGKHFIPHFCKHDEKETLSYRNESVKNEENQS